MIFHEPDRSFRRLAGCYKRATRFSKAGLIPHQHALAAAWSNCKYFLDAEQGEDVDALKKAWVEDRMPLPRDHQEEGRIALEAAFSIVCLDWFASKVDAYLECNMLEGDEALAAMLSEWQLRMKFDPSRLVR